MEPLAVNLCIIQPAGYVYSLLFLDPARYLRYHLRRLGIDCTLTRNRLARDRVNIVFGAHMGFDRALANQFCCVIFNTEQIGDGGAELPAAYLDLLRAIPSVDYDSSNRDAYSSPLAGPVVPIMDAPFLRSGAAALPLAERPIDLLFFGVINDRRARLLNAIEAAGCQVTLFDKPLFGPERDQFIGQSKAVLNLHHYESGRFEQIRAGQCLSLGTPVISERTASTSSVAHFENTVLFLPTDQLPEFLGQAFRSPGFYSEAERMLAAFQAQDPSAHFRDLATFLQSVRRAWLAAPTTELSLRLRRMNLGSGKDYLPGWINVDINKDVNPDLVLDLSRPLQLPLTLQSPTLGALTLQAGSLEAIYANNVLEHVADLPALMTNALTLLGDRGIFAIEVPYEGARTAWQDPTHVRALNENSWRYYTEWFWYLGWYTHRFEVARFEFLDEGLAVCQKPAAAFMRVLLRKLETTLQERMLARMIRPDFGPGLEDDWPPALKAKAA
jgi:SAM-dependent methyltransferase